MIRIHRGAEPATLPPVRAAELARVRLLVAGGTLSNKTIGREYSIVRDDLLRAQHFKCCYCERDNLEASYNDVEHFRPKLRADRGAGFPAHGYWWLAWSWRNLMFSCATCNRSHKKDSFPLSPGSAALVPEQRRTGLEQPLLIDPCTTDPMRHIQFRLVTQRGKPRWLPMPRSGTIEGLKTIEVLGLDRPGLLELYQRHVRRNVEPIVARLHDAINTATAPGVQAIWQEQACSLIAPEAPFSALSHDALDHYVPRATRRAWRLSLRRPG